MKKILLAVLMLTLALSAVTQAQDAPPNRPENMGVSDFDTFKNNSFDILDESTKLKTEATRIDTDVKSYSAGLASVSVDKLKADLKAIRQVGRSSKELSTRIGSLDEQGKELLASAKSVKPMTKSPAATNNTNKSIKGLDVSRKNLNEVTELVSTNTKFLTDELIKRGETVEED